MQCENIVNGKPCKTNLLSTEIFCPECGYEVKLDSVKTQPCRKCQVLVVEGHKFCSNCKWKIDQDIFKVNYEDPVAKLKSDGSTNTGDGKENPLDGQKQPIGTNPHHGSEKVSEDSLNGNTSTPTISEPAGSDDYSNQSTNTNSQQQKVFGAAKPVSQDGDIGLSTFTPAKVAFLYGQDTSERFTNSTIFGNFNRNTNCVNISNEQSGNSGQGASSDNGGCSKNLIHDATDNLSTADGGSADIEMSEDESITSSSIASGADVQDIQTNKSKRPGKKTRDRMKRQKEKEKSTVDNDQSRLPNDNQDTNTETDEIQNKDKDGMSHTNNDDKSNKDNDDKSNKENDNKSNKDNDNKSESKIDQKGATSSQHGNNENGKTKDQSDIGKEKNKSEAGKTGNSLQHGNNKNGKTKVQSDTSKEKNKAETGKTGNSSQHGNNKHGKTKVQSDTSKEKNKTKTGKTGNSSKTEEQKTDKQHSSGNDKISENQPDANKNKNESNNSSKGSQPNSSGKTDDKGNTCPSNNPQTRSYAAALSGGYQDTYHNLNQNVVGGNVEICFHVVFSPSILQNPQKDVPCFTFENLDHSRSYKKMQMEREWEDGFIVYNVHYTFPMYMINVGFYYTYCVQRGNETIWEHFAYDGKLTEKGIRRCFIIPNVLQPGIFHVYDGVVREHPDKKSKNVFIRFKDVIWEKIGIDEYRNVLIKDAEVAVSAFHPKWQLSGKNSDGMNGEEMLNHVRYIITGLRKVYVQTVRLWYSGSDFDQIVAGFLLPKVKRMIKELHKRKKETLTDDGQTLHLVTALTLTWMVVEHGINLDPECTTLLCEALLPSLTMKRDNSSDINGLKDYFPSQHRTAGHHVLSYSRKIAKDSMNPCWMYCLPVIHFLLGKCRTFEEPSNDMNHSSSVPVWWGVDDFKGDNDTFKNKVHHWERPVEEVLQRLTPYFEIDYLLPRSFMTSLKMKELEPVISSKAIPLEVSLAALFYYLKSQTDEALLKKLLQIVSRQCRIENPEMSVAHLKSAWRSYRIALDLTNESLRFPHHNKDAPVHILAFETFLVTVNLFDGILNGLKQMKNGEIDKITFKDDHWIEYKTVQTKFTNWVSSEVFNYHELQYLKNWKLAFDIKIPDGRIKNSYFQCIESQLKRALKEKNEDTFLEVYCKNYVEFTGKIQEILCQIALKAVENFNTIDWRGLTDESQKAHYVKLLSEVFMEKTHAKDLSNTHESLQHVLNYTSFPTYVEMFYNYEKYLSENCRKILSKVISMLYEINEKLMDGSIKILDLRHILKSSDSFQKTVSMLRDQDTDSIISALTVRQEELEEFEKTKQVIQKFVGNCLHFKVDVTALDEKLKAFENLDKYDLNMIVKTISLEERRLIPEYRPTVSVFEFSDEELEILPLINDHCQGLLFMKLWEKRGRELSGQKVLSVKEVLDEVWIPVSDQWNGLCRRLESGNMMFSEFEHFFRNTNIDNLKQEFQLIARGGNGEWIQERLVQVEKFRNLRACRFGAEAILEVVTEFELEGDFSQIEDVLKLTTGTDTCMNKLDHSLVDTCSILNEVNDDRADCLKKFIKCKPLVRWIKEAMPSGLKELKVFVDLASISAGEGDMEIAKVNCLHSATTGYAPLIFNLEKECDSKMFLEKCQEVWKELDANPKLPEKLVDTNRQLALFQTVEKSHGSVEVSSLTQVEAINSRGIYKVGNLKKHQYLKKPCLTEVFELRVTEEEGETLQRKRYTYKQLHDLQSRLMLIAGKAEKGKDEVDRFMLILDSVVRLGNIFTKLVADGCVLFAQWHVNFLCDQSRHVCAFLNFGYGENTHTIRGRVDDDNDDVSAIIPKLAKFLEECHKKWLDFITEKREKYYLLNFFTVDQMVILQQEVVKIGSTEEPSNVIYPLLSAVKRGCTKENLVTAISLAEQNVDEFDAQQNGDEEGDIHVAPSEDSEEEKEDVKKRKFLDELTMAGYSLTLAKKALEHVDVDKIDDAIVWCLDHEDDDMGEKQDSWNSKEADDELDEDISFPGWIQTDQSLLSVTADLVEQLGVGSHEKSTEDLIKDLENLWGNFLNSISSSVSDYLSVEHLGLILNRLAEQETFEVDRSLLTCFKEGEPNLIICPQSEIYNTVLAVYSHEDDRPLPQSDEVLLCTPHTTLDMLEIFWRRALFADNNKVHCLVNADLLDYDVSDKGEKSLERHMKYADSQGKKYKLVVICSSENEYKSRIVAALDKYHKPQLPIDVQNVRKYLLTKLKVERSQTGVRPASAVDFESCSVRVVKSLRAGVGKTLYKERMVANLEKLVPGEPGQKSTSVTIPLHEKAITTDVIMDVFLQETLSPRYHQPRIFHIDISHEVQEGVDALLFQLLVLGCLAHSSGHVWRRSELDYYIIENMPLLARDSDMQGGKLKCIHHCLDILPEINCRSPCESIDILNDRNLPATYTVHDILFDSIEFKSDIFQRPYQYLLRLDANRKLDDVKPTVPEGNRSQCLETLLRHCGIKDPSWSELHHFVSFLSKQLQDFEVSVFCGAATGQDLPGFSKFVLRFLIQMSRDFSTRSLKVSEESPMQRQVIEVEDEEENEDGEVVLQLYQMRRTWETSPHPYLFFNPDHHTMTFLGFNIDRRTGNLIDLQTRNILEQRIMDPGLYDALVRNRVNLAENFDGLPRAQKIEKLCNVMGQMFPHDPDETYELTTDNVKKILAIYMRFRCDIPVVIMGETGCGKTRLIKFMCSLQKPPGVNVQNMVLMKVHGGTKTSDIVKKVRKAEEMARKNAADYPSMDTVLFFDEANTTEAIGVIKEIMCDKSLGGKPIKLHERLKIVAACNPYRKHSEELIKRLEQAGLGYHVDADKTTDRFGRVPMRRLVYRVQPLPQSMLPLVWDFGQLNREVEEMYIRQMVLRYINNGKLPNVLGLDTVTSTILTVSQQFMRDQKDECSFVSLRDVERVLEVMSWFYNQRDNELLFQQMNTDFEEYDSELDEEDEYEERQQPLDDVTRSLVLSLGVCYHACLKNREEYREAVAGYFRPPLQLPRGADQINEEIEKCQSVFLENVDLAPNIAKNQALKENVFMMIVCIELRIPMFLVGKPGSSKSLAKTIVADAMQGNAAHKDLFKNYKQVQMVSFQCSPLSTPEGIVGTFRQCAAYQKDKNLDRFVSIVVLDEIGLAEDSPKMPLKTLHPLLEDGCHDDEETDAQKKTQTKDGCPDDEKIDPHKKTQAKDGCPDDEKIEPHKKVAFIGISNWALDPAKMNRGILVQREVPDEMELINSAHGICSTDQDVLNILTPMIPSLAASYLKLFEVSTEMREFFGLRDFYSLVKMLYTFVETSGYKKPTWPQLEHSILRNFGGLENVEPVDVFYQNLSSFIIKNQKKSENDPDCTSAGMIQACLIGDSRTDCESRYLLLLTENYGALSILQQKILTMDNAIVIFGSSFPSDQEYTQVCRNINRIKVCMETGSTVILLNLENLYESLYDALNQYYVRFGGEKYVDLGLGTHRVKCRVHDQFRLIVVAEKQIVYDKFPIPLINRLEKHFLSLKTLLPPAQLELADKLQKWAQNICKDKTLAPYGQKKDIRKIGDAFMGYHDDTCAAIILHVCQEKRCDDQAIPQIEKEILSEAQSIMLWCSTPAAVWEQDIAVFSMYFREQHHDSLADYLHYKMVDEHQHNIHTQITTNSKLLSTADIDDLCKCIPIQRQNVTLLTLQSFDTEQQFSRKIRSCFDQSNTYNMLLIVQCDCGDQNADLIACARYTVQGELQQVRQDRTTDIHVVFLIQLPGIAGGCFTGFQCGLWHSVHIDDLHPSPEDIPSIADMHGKSVSALLSPAEVKIPTDSITEQENQTEESEQIDNILTERSDPTESMTEQENKIERSEEMENIVSERNESIVRPKRHFDINRLIQNCVHPALAKVKDLEKDSSRGTERLKIILKFLHHGTGISDTLLACISSYLTNILLEKEQSGGHLTASWLSTEAARTNNINKAGTFRRFAVQCLHSKVIPILAGIIAFIDTNRNLNILTSHDIQSWQIDLWIQIFNNSDITQLKYSNIVSPWRRTELQEIIVKSTAVDGKVFSAVMPFSWLIYRQVDETLKTTKESEEYMGESFEIVRKAAEIFAELPIGKLLASVEGAQTLDILRLYVIDFVHMVYPIQTEDECKIVCENIMIGCRQLIKAEFGRLLPSLVGLHMTYILHAARFKNFSYMVNVWPECSNKVLTFQQNESMYLVTEEEITLDVLAMYLLVNNLEPQKDQLNTQENSMKWLRLVCDYRPVIERIVGLNQTDNNEYMFGERCKTGIHDTRFQWSRVIVVKLFIEHVLSSTDGEQSRGIRCMPLWIALGTDTDLKTIHSLEKIEKFLKSCNRKVVAKYFGDNVNCISCENPVQGVPVTLPCEHTVCRRCFADSITMNELECTQCHAEFPQDFNPDETPENSGSIKKYQNYRRRCNSFFMEVVSQLCFAEGTPPSKEVIQKLLSYITGHRKSRKGERIVSRELTIFDDSFDPTPVVRSFLLQQLMHTSGEEVYQYLDSYFDHTSKLLGATGQEQLVELCLLILQCMEDSLHQQNSKRSNTLNSQHYIGGIDTNDETKMAKDLLQEASPNLCNEIETLNKIRYIANTRFALSVVAKYIHNMYGTTQRKIRINANIRRMFSAAAQLCDDCESPWPRRYFVKQLCRCYSIDSYHSVLTMKDVSFLSWVQLPELVVKKVNNCFDRYIVCGEDYTNIRETIVETIIKKDDTQLTAILQKSQNDWQTRIKLMLSLHREITMSHVNEEQHQRFTEEGKAVLEQLVDNQPLLQNKELIADILGNTVWKLDQERNIKTDMDLAQQNVTCLLTHFLILMREIPGKTTLVSPLKLLSLKPQNMVVSFFPTMPEDDIADIKEALLAARMTNVDENPVFYRCPNGHPYVIGDCGRPYVERKCHECGEQIGGKGHVLRRDNEKDDGKDRSETGHILGRATKLGPVVAPERKLDKASFAILRLLTHISMYLGADVDVHALCASIKPDIEVKEVPTYLIEHIELDLNMIQTALGKNKDDVLVLIHYILSQMMDIQTMAVIGGDVPEDVCRLSSREGRAKWEELFTIKYITPVLQNIDNILTTWNNVILNDKRLGSDHLLQLLYETKPVDETQDISNLQDIPAIWRYKARISVDHLMQTLNISNQRCPVMRLFLKEEHHLRAIRFAPSILCLQKLLIQKYNKKLDRAEANTLTIKEVKEHMSQDRKLEEFETLVADFIEAWECVRESLETYACPANETLCTVNKEYCRTRITDDTPVSYLLPTHKHTGLCSYVLLFFLMDKQNMFLSNYCQKRKIREDSLPKVHVKDISSAHLISYHPDRDLLPMVLANCNYSFEVGQGTKVEYNFTNLERQLMDRFLFSKSVIGKIQEIETFTHRAESTNGLVFKFLSHRIKQERLSQSVQSQINGELRSKTFPDLCESLDKLDIAISFLKSVGSDPDSSLNDFMINTLKMDNPFPSPKAKQVCKCKHTMSWWVTLSLERARRQTKYKQEAFEGLSEKIKVMLNDEQRKTTEVVLDNLPIEQTEILVSLVYELIVLRIDVAQNKEEDEDSHDFDMSNMSLCDALTAYVEYSPYDEDTLVDQTLLTAISKLPSDLEDENRILTGQSVDFWKLINGLLISKHRGFKCF